MLAMLSSRKRNPKRWPERLRGVPTVPPRLLTRRCSAFCSCPHPPCLGCSLCIRTGCVGASGGNCGRPPGNTSRATRNRSGPWSSTRRPTPYRSIFHWVHAHLERVQTGRMPRDADGLLATGTCTGSRPRMTRCPLEHGGALARFTPSSSVWEHASAGWQFTFHQGTPTAAYIPDSGQPEHEFLTVRTGSTSRSMGRR